MTHIVTVGVDGSDHSNAALRWAVRQAELRDGEVRAVFAWQLPFVSIPGAFDRGELEQAVKNFLLSTIATVVPDTRVKVTPLVAEGDPSESLVEASKDADALVLGVRGRSPFVGLILGAVSQRCAATARCPVVLVKPPDFDAARIEQAAEAADETEETEETEETAGAAAGALSPN
jgi:nucleotide-binding universal stress UspA family protein